MATILIVLHSLIVLALIAVVLLQRSEGGVAAGMGGGMNMGGIMSPRGGKNFMTQLTAILATIFISSSLLLAIIIRRDNAPSSIVDKIVAPVGVVPVPGIPDAPAIPAGDPAQALPVAPAPQAVPAVPPVE